MHNSRTTQVERANRVALASSLYMKQSSVQLPVSNQGTAKQSRQRQQSFGKIVRNKSQKSVPLEQIKNIPSSPARAQNPVCKPSRCIVQNKIRLQRELDIQRKTPIFGMMDDAQNKKIKAIEDKYARMLEEYESKKQMIAKQITALKTKREISNKQNQSITSREISKNSFAFFKQNSHQTHQIQLKQFKEEIKPKINHAIVDQWPEKRIQTHRQMKQTDKYHTTGGFYREETDKNTKYSEMQEKISKKLAKNTEEFMKLNQGAKSMHVRSKSKVFNKFSLFFTTLQTQINFQNDLRDFKQHISSLQDEKLKQQIFNCCREQVQDRFVLVRLAQEQTDPFFLPYSQLNKIFNEKTDARQFAAKFMKLYRKCQDNWKKICGSLSETEAAQIYKILNFENLDEVSLKSFVRELSLIFDKSLRNRDLYAIHHRLQPLKKQHFIKIMGHPQ